MAEFKFQVNVLQPDGRRQIVKVNPNTTILEILDQVCQKINLSSNEYDLKHYRNVLDVTSTVRFCGLPQHAQLELIPAKQPRIDLDVTLCLQLDSGERINGKSSPSTTLWEVLQQVAPERIEAYDNPVIIYARREIIGKENLTKTTLRGIGLTGGRAALRLINKSVDELRTQAHVTAPLQRPPHNPSPPQQENPTATPGNTDETTSVKPSSVQEPVLDIESKHVSDSDISAHEEMSTDLQEIGDNNSDKCTNSEAPDNDHSDDINIGGKRPRVSSPVVPPEEIQLERVILLGDRNAVAYNLDTIAPTLIEDLPDDFYDLTLGDVRSLAAAAHRAVVEMDNAPMLTAQQRQLDHDGMGCFKPIETIEDICEFVKEYLHDPSWDFYLYTTPPKSILNKAERLVEANCFPSANLYLGIKGESHKTTYLKEDVINRFSSHIAANQTASMSRQHDKVIKNTPVELETGRLVSDAPSTSSLLKEDVAAITPRSNKGGGVQSSEGNRLPKWFKLAK